MERSAPAPQVLPVFAGCHPAQGSEFSTFHTRYVRRGSSAADFCSRTFFKVFGAGDGNRTHMIGLGGRRSAVELHPHTLRRARLWRHAPQRCSIFEVPRFYPSAALGAGHALIFFISAQLVLHGRFPPLKSLPASGCGFCRAVAVQARSLCLL